MADNYGPPPQPSPAHERLGAFVGKWHAEGQSYGGPRQNRKDPKANAERWVSDEVTEWHPGQFFVVQREDATIGSGSLITHAVLGYDAEAGHYVSHAFENHGHYRRYIGRVDGNVWTWSGDTERCRIEFSEDGNHQTVLRRQSPHRALRCDDNVMTGRTIERWPQRITTSSGT